EIVVRELHGIAVEQRRDVVLAVFRDLERRAVDAVDGRHRDALAVDDELRRLERLVRRELDGDLRAFDGADVVAGLDDLRLELRPVRIVVRELQARDARQVDDVDRVLGATQARGGYVVPHRLAQREHLHARRLEALGRRLDAQIAAAAHRAVARLHRQVLWRQRVFDEPARPEIADAVAPVVGPAQRGPDEQREGAGGEHRGRAHLQRRHFQGDGDLASKLQRVLGEQTQEWRGALGWAVND